MSALQQPETRVPFQRFGPCQRVLAGSSLTKYHLLWWHWGLRCPQHLPDGIPSLCSLQKISCTLFSKQTLSGPRDFRGSFCAGVRARPGSADLTSLAVKQTRKTIGSTERRGGILYRTARLAAWANKPVVIHEHRSSFWGSGTSQIGLNSSTQQVSR